MIRSTQFFAALLVASLVAAWLEWTAEESVDLDGKVVVLEGKPEAITAVRWVGEDTETTVTRRSDSNGEFFWVDYTRWTEKTLPAARSASDTGEAPEPEVERIAKPSVFKSAQRSESLMESFSPLAAKRSLVVDDAEKLIKLGLASPSSRIEIDRGGTTETLDIGSEAYGTRDYYARHARTGRIYLLERDLVQPLKYARTRLPDRTLHSFDRAEIVTADLSAADQKSTWKHHDADDKMKAYWTPVDSPDDEAEQANTWLDKFLGLKGTKYADPSDPPSDLSVRFVLTLSGETKSETVEVLQVGDDGDWYARSGHTRGLLKLVRSGASELADGVQPLLSSSAAQ